jgi:hypothetical protein
MQQNGEKFRNTFLASKAACQHPAVLMIFRFDREAMRWLLVVI